MDPSRYATLFSLDKSHHAVRRLLGVYVPAFDDIRAFAQSGSGNPLFPGQHDVRSEWKAILGPDIVAISWDILHGMDVVMVLLDDPEFGRDIQWYFSPATTMAVDFKLLILFVETSLELILHVVKDPSILQRIEQAPVVDVQVVERGSERIRSPSFCLAVESGNLIPSKLEQLATLVEKESISSETRSVFLESGPFKASVFSWSILASVHACVARDVGCMGGALQVHLDKAIMSQDAFSKSLLIMIRVQLEAITGIISSSLNPKKTTKRESTL